MPRLNIAALFLPPIWGPAYGIWAAIVFYPLWLIADTCFVNAVSLQTPLAITLGVLVFVGLTAITFAFAIVSQPFALHRSLEAGKTKEAYLKQQRMWAFVSVPVGLAMIAAATYYNLFLNPELAFLGFQA